MIIGMKAYLDDVWMTKHRKACYFVIFVILLGLCQPLHVQADGENGAGYEIHTKWYERWPDNRRVIIKFAKITGIEDQRICDNINYILEREAFRLAGTFIPYDIKRKSENILQAISKLQDQAIWIDYEILYRDDKMLSIEIHGGTCHYTEDGEVYLSADSEHAVLFDIRTGRKLELSDFVELDRRIIDYRADDYQVPDYNSAAQTLYYSFMDAFGVYEDDNEKDQFHRRMNIEEALEWLRDGSIEWAVVENKTLLLYLYVSSREQAWIEIPYSYIEEFAYY
ncbi:MAG: hypothetical protein HDQ98_00340 [Lachnospiraceae bacterium]|nr:hypothetical protein [Lachnospiraceae bacterium]